MNEDKLKETKVKELKETVEKALKQIEALEKPNVWEPKTGGYALNGDFTISMHLMMYAKEGMTGSKEELKDRAKMLRANALIHAYICEKGTLNAGEWIIMVDSSNASASYVGRKLLLDTQTDEATAKELAEKINSGEVVL